MTCFGDDMDMVSLGIKVLLALLCLVSELDYVNSRKSGPEHDVIQNTTTAHSDNDTTTGTSSDESTTTDGDAPTSYSVSVSSAAGDVLNNDVTSTGKSSTILYERFSIRRSGRCVDMKVTFLACLA